MPKRDLAPIGAPCWIDLFTSDPDQSAAFYGELLGWKVVDPGPDYGGYKNFTLDDVMVAGFMGNDGSTGQPDAWNVYLAVEDAQATADAATAAGATVFVPPMPVMALGTMAVMADPGGATIGLWQPGEHHGFGIYSELNAPTWFELHTSAYDTSVAFYRDVYHWPVHTAADSPEFRYTTYGEGDDQLAGIMDASQWLGGAPASWSVYLSVENADAALARTEQLGGAIVQPAEDTPYGRLATATDVTGATFKLHQVI
jgi:hypothetical protein